MKMKCFKIIVYIQLLIFNVGPNSSNNFMLISSVPHLVIQGLLILAWHTQMIATNKIKCTLRTNSNNCYWLYIAPFISNLSCCYEDKKKIWLGKCNPGKNKKFRIWINANSIVLYYRVMFPFWDLFQLLLWMWFYACFILMCIFQC